MIAAPCLLVFGENSNPDVYFFFKPLLRFLVLKTLNCWAFFYLVDYYFFTVFLDKLLPSNLQFTYGFTRCYSFLSGLEEGIFCCLLSRCILKVISSSGLADSFVTPLILLVLLVLDYDSWLSIKPFLNLLDWLFSYSFLAVEGTFET